MLIFRSVEVGKLDLFTSEYARRGTRDDTDEADEADEKGVSMRRSGANTLPIATSSTWQDAVEVRGADGQQRSRSTRQQLRSDVLAGLRSRPRRLSSLYFYDDAGSALFEEITRLPEYYLTRVEREILETHADRIIEPVLSEPCCIVDLGAGDGDKTRILLERIHARGGDVRYVPLDVSAAALWSAEQRMQKHLPWLRVDAVHDEYVAGLARVRAAQAGRKLLILWLGSSIGNFAHEQAAQMLRGLTSVCDTSDTLLVGFDLLKDPQALVAAYADSQGVTARFNYNLLVRINRELGADFDPDAFVHHASFSPDRARMESYLISKKQQTVSVAGSSFEFDAWEPIHTEVSCKYSERQIASLLSAAGLAHIETFSDPERRFADVACGRSASKIKVPRE
jgi:L-histidine N-alpha-methyltransferase